MPRRPAFALLLALVAAPALADPPLDLWTGEVMARIRDQSTLNARVITHFGYHEVFYDSETDANWADSTEPYGLHKGDKIRIHGYLAGPPFGGPYPAVVIGHGHRGRGAVEIVQRLAALGYVALAIDGPEAGSSTGGPEDTEQAWISVEEVQNVASPSFSYLYHYAYAGMRGLTLLEHLAGWRRPWKNPFRINKDKLGVLGASMGGQFTYYINGVDSRVKAAVAIAVAGDWFPLIFYPGSWLYHGLYYYTRDGLQHGMDDLNTVSDVCSDPTLQTFMSYFDPISYAKTQHGPLLTIIGTHDQYFSLPAINTTYDAVSSAGSHPSFRKNVTLVPNGKHGVLKSGDDVKTLLDVVLVAHAWLRHAFGSGPRPPATPVVTLTQDGADMVFRAEVAPGDWPVTSVDLHFATQVDARPPVANDFGRLSLQRKNGHYEGRLSEGSLPPSGPPATPQNVLYFASVKDLAGFNVTSKMYYGPRELQFCDDFFPTLDRFPRDPPMPPVDPPAVNCACPRPSPGPGS